MNKKIAAALAAALILSAAGAAFGQTEQVSFKLSAGLAAIRGGDYNAGVTGLNAYMEDTGLAPSGSFGRLKNGPDLQFEIVNFWGPHFGVGIGGGYYIIENTSTVTMQGFNPEFPSYALVSARTPKVSTIPFFLNVHYRMALTPRLGLDAYAGGLFEVVQFSFARHDTSTLDALDLTETFKASGVSLGAQAGLGISFRLFKSLSLVLDGVYRGTKISNLKGNWFLTQTTTSGGTETNSNSSYYLWAYDLTTGGKTYPQTGFFDAAGPSGAEISAARKAEIDLSGFCAFISLRVSL